MHLQAALCCAGTPLAVTSSESYGQSGMLGLVDCNWGLLLLIGKRGQNGMLNTLGFVNRVLHAGKRTSA